MRGDALYGGRPGGRPSSDCNSKIVNAAVFRHERVILSVAIGSRRDYCRLRYNLRPVLQLLINL